MEFLGRVRWTNDTPATYANFYYEYARDGANMKYRTKIVIEPITGYSYYGWQINAVVSSEGAQRASVRLKENSPSQWSSNIEWTSDWWTVNNKTTGTSSLSIRLYSNDGDRDATYNYSMYVAPAYASCNQSFNSKTETTIKMNWSSDNTCDYIWYSTNNGSNWTAVGSVNSTNGSYTISGLSANTTYQIKTRVRRKDSQLTTDSSKLDVQTYDYPKLATNGGPDFYIESPVTITIYNPRSLACTVIVYDKNGNEIGSTTTSGTTAGPFLNDNTSTLRMYSSIPNNPEGRYSVKVNITGHTGSSVSGGLYKASKSLCEPTFTDYRLRDVDEDTRLLTGDNTVQIVGYSDMAAIIPTENRAEPKHGASMSYYRFIIGNSSPVDVTYSYDRDVSAILNNAPAGSCKVYAYDSRGFSKLVEKTPQTILYYTDITRGPISIVRQNGNIGEAVTLTFSGTFWNEDFGNVHNAITSSNVTYQYKKTTDSTWSPGSSTISPATAQGSNDYSFSGSILGDTNNGFDTRYSYNIEVTVSDKLSSTTFSVILGSGSPGLAVHDNGIAVKQPYDTTDDSVLQVNGKAKIKGNTSIIGNISASGTLSSTGNGSIGGTLTVGSYTRNTTDTWMPVIKNGTLEYTTRVIWNSKQSTGYNTEQDRLVTLAALSYWNGAYNTGNASNLTYAHQGEIQCKPKTLYSNDNGNNGTVTLSESVANFRIIDIAFRTNDGTTYIGSNRIYRYVTSGTYSLFHGHCIGSSTWYKTKEINMSGTSITVVSCTDAGWGGASSDSNVIYITRVIGYK